MKKISSILFLLAIYSQCIMGQSANKPNGLNLIASNNPGSNWYIFDKGTVPSPENINSQSMKKYFGFNNDNSFSLVKSATDELKMTHHTFQQLYKGYPVQLAIFKLHESQDKPVEGNGHWVADLVKNLATPIPFPAALNLAKQYFPAQLYMWEDSLEEASWKKRKQ
jgi:Zn-dependent metalloprotease